MPYLLDTNVCVNYLTGRYPPVIQRIRRASPDDLRLSAIVVAKLRYGADHSGHPGRNHGRIDVLVAEIDCLDFDLEAAAAYGRVRAALEAVGKPIGPNGMLIGAHALSRGLGPGVRQREGVSQDPRLEGRELAGVVAHAYGWASPRGHRLTSYRSPYKHRSAA